ncbi:MAG: transcriptional repressor [Clostridia bacterium]
MQDIKVKRNTAQKEIIERLVLSACNHPTAETIYNSAREEMPTISLGTVYRILSTLVKEGIVREIMVPNAPSRFDKTTRIHAHFVCKACGSVTDIKIDEPKILEEAKNCIDTVDEAEIIFKGVCDKCKQV